MNNDSAINLFISTGALVGFYTLNINVVEEGISKNTFIKNLSTDKNKALSEALEYSKRFSIPLISDADFDLNEIKRKTREEAERAEFEKIERERIEKETYAKEVLDAVTGKVFIGGKYAGISVSKVFETDPTYILYLADQYNEKESNCKEKINYRIAHNFCIENNVGKPEYIGVNEEKIEIEVVLRAVTIKEGIYPSWKYICTNGINTIMFNTNSKKFASLNVGDTFKVSGKVVHLGFDKKINFINKPKRVA